MTIMNNKTNVVLQDLTPFSFFFTFSLPLYLQRKALESGMQVVAEIHQGRRTIMEYLLSPVQKVANEAGRER